MPFNVNVQSTAGESFGRGLGGFIGNLLSYGAGKHMETKALNEKASALDKLVKAEPSILSTMKIGDDEWKGMSAKEKSLTFEGYKEQEAISKALANNRYTGEMANTMEARRLADQEQVKQIGNAMSALNSTLTGGPVTIPAAPRYGISQQTMQRPAVNPNSPQMQQAISTILKQNPQAEPAIGNALKLFAAAGPQARPGTVMDVPGAPGYVFGVASPSGAGSFLPRPGAAPANPLEAEMDRARLANLNARTDQIRAKLEADYPLDDGMPMRDQQRVDQLTREIAELEGLKAGGEKYHGFLNLNNIETTLKRNRKELDTLLNSREQGSAKRQIQQSAPVNQELPTVTTRDAYNQLPKGARFIGEDGNIYEKPDA